MESSRRDLFIDMVVDRFIFKNNQITLSPCFTFTPKTRTGLPETGVSFYCVASIKNLADARAANFNLFTSLSKIQVTHL